MNELLIAVLGFVVLLLLILARVPIAAAMALVGVGGTAWDVPMATIYRGILPFLAAQIVLLVLLTLWPGIALLRPGTMR